MNDNKGAVGRKRKKNGFTQISNTMLEDDRLSWRAKGILSYMLSRPDNWKIQKSDLYKRATEGRDAMQNALNELKEFSYLHIYQERTENGRFIYIWEYDDVPFSPEVSESRTTENPQENDEIAPVSRTLESRTLENRKRVSRRRFSSTLNNTGLNNTKNNTKNNKEKNKKHMLNSSELEREFETLWKLYPRKEGKKKAFDSFKKSRKDKKVPYETIENGLYRYLRHIEQQGTEEQYILHGSTFFNQERWRDEYTVTGVFKKPKNAMEYMRMKYGGEMSESSRNGEIIDYYSEVIPELF